MADVIDNGKLTANTDGRKELESQISLNPLQDGKTSIGVRQDERYRYKGSIYLIKISHEALNPKKFLHF